MKKLIYAAMLYSGCFFSCSFGVTVLENDRVSATVNRNGVVTIYGYDALGNIKQEGDVKFEYSDAGQLSSVFLQDTRTEYRYDDFGRMISDGIAAISYDESNGMMNRYARCGTEASYSYDRLTGLRASKTVNGHVTQFVLDSLGRVVEEQDESGSSVAKIIWDGDLPSQYVFGGHTYSYRCNAHGDVVALLDENGELVNSYVYDIWGKLLEVRESVPNAIRYNHEYYDEETGLYYLRGRYYNPTIRRFTTPDPAEDGINWYAYCGNNPVKYIDPSGYVFLQKAEPFKLIRYYSGDDLVDIIDDPSKVVGICGEHTPDTSGAILSTVLGTGLAALLTCTSLPVVAADVLGSLGGSAITSVLEDYLPMGSIKQGAKQAYDAKCGLIVTNTV